MEGLAGSRGAGFEWAPRDFSPIAIEEASDRERIWQFFEIYNRGVRAAKAYFEMIYGRPVPARTLAYTAEEDEGGWRIVVDADEGDLALEAEKELYRTLRQVLGESRHLHMPKARTPGQIAKDDNQHQCRSA